MIDNINTTDCLRLLNTNEFSQWRADYSINIEYVYYTFNEQEKYVQFQMKLVTRKRVIKELQIGDVRTNCPHDALFLVTALKALTKRARKISFLSIISIAINEQADSSLNTSLIKNAYKRTTKSIFFMVKPFVPLKDLIDAKQWLIYRSDIDTW